MSSMKDRLLSPEVRPHLVEDCCGLIDQAVKSAKGMSGFALKGAYSTVKAIKPRFVEGVVDALMDEWMEKLELFETEHTQKGSPGTFASYILANQDRVAEALVEVTDKRAETTKHKMAAKLYLRMRPSSIQHVKEQLPELMRVVEKHAAQPAA